MTVSYRNITLILKNTGNLIYTFKNAIFLSRKRSYIYTIIYIYDISKLDV